MISPIVTTFMLGLSAAALTAARMELPADMPGDSQRIELSGFGGRNKGDYSITELSGVTRTGAFSRTETRLGIFDPLYVTNKGKSSFDFPDAATGARIYAECGFRKVTVTVDVVTMDKKKVAYQCEFTGAPSTTDAGSDTSPGASFGARFVLGQPKRKGFGQKMLARDLRAGEATLYGENLLFESVHEYAGTPLTSQAPVGYLIRSAERLLAAVELTDVDPGVYLISDLTDTERQAVLVAALAIAVFRDPALSALEPD